MNLSSFTNVEAWFGLLLYQFYMWATPLRAVESLNTDRRKRRLRCCHPPYHAKKQHAFPKHFIHWATAAVLSRSSVICPSSYPCVQGWPPPEVRGQQFICTYSGLGLPAVWQGCSICILPFAHHHSSQALKRLCHTIWCPDFHSLLNYCHILQPL